MDAIHIDINCDVGEGMGNENGLLPFISSCNIACGGHAGDEETMLETIKLAKKYKVRAGAHPSYPDRENFGRTSMEIPEDGLIHSIRSQIADLNSLLNKEQVPLHHIKPHGALYNDLAQNRQLSLVFLEAVTEFKKDAILYVPFNSYVEEEAEKKGFRVMREAFADRNYNADLSLVSRNLPDALIRDPQKVLQHLTGMVMDQEVRTLKGEKIAVHADTFCVHGDTPMAIEIVRHLFEKLPERNILLYKYK